MALSCSWVTYIEYLEEEGAVSYVNAQPLLFGALSLAATIAELRSRGGCRRLRLKNQCQLKLYSNSCIRLNRSETDNTDASQPTPLQRTFHNCLPAMQTPLNNPSNRNCSPNVVNILRTVYESITESFALRLNKPLIPTTSRSFSQTCCWALSPIDVRGEGSINSKVRTLYTYIAYHQSMGRKILIVCFLSVLYS